MTDDDEPKKRKKPKFSPTSHALKECKARGYIAQVVEKFVRFPPPGHRVDLFGVIDIVAITPSGILGIQATSNNGGTHAARVHKIHAEPRARAWLAHARLEVWSFALRTTGKQKRYELRVERISAEDCAAAAPATEEAA